jgi:DNA polymerase III epsilon subunit-like protein
MYAIVDIETTGGHASANGITEVVVHDGQQVIEQFKTLINPLRSIQFMFRRLPVLMMRWSVQHRNFRILPIVFMNSYDKVFAAQCQF